MGDETQPPQPRPISVLVVGANGYLGLAVCRAFLRAAAPTGPGHPCPYRVYGLVRRPSAARDLLLNEVTPIVGDLSDTEDTLAEILTHGKRWDVIVTCTEPAKTDPVAEAEHWDAIFKLVTGLTEASNEATNDLASDSRRGSRRPLVLWSSGCKDYGTTGLHGSPGLQPHTEASPLDAPLPIRGRTDAALKALELARDSRSGIGSPGFDVAVVRATPIFGYSGSYFGAAFEYASRVLGAKAENGDDDDDDGRALEFAADEGTILHSLHVDDCADAYVALATTALLRWGEDEDKEEEAGSVVAGEVFNVSGRRYETLGEVGRALAAEYGFTGGARFGVSPDDGVPGPADDMTGYLVFGWSQWVASDKIRKVTGWADRRPLFSADLGVYRKAYEAAKAQGNENVGSISRRMAGDWGERPLD